MIALLCLLIWVYLLCARGGFWRAREHDDAPLTTVAGVVPAVAVAAGSEGDWPTVVAVIPARNEAASIGQAVESLCRQDYPGPLSIVVVDDQSDDGTAALARQAAERAGSRVRVTVLTGAALPSGWTGKLWAVHQGVAAACVSPAMAAPLAVAPDWLLLTDADIAHRPDNLRHLVMRARGEARVLVSLMARLRCDAWFERALVPAFVLFFQMLYPFAWVNRRDHRLAAAAGGCMLVQRQALEAVGGVASIRHQLIDDCALGAQLQTQGAIWLGLTDRAHSIRPYDDFAELRRMISRSAYAQLKYSPWLLAGTIFGMVLTFVAGPAYALFGSGWPRLFGLAAWLAMAWAYQPMLRFYGRSRWWGPALPAIAALYTGLTLDSAIQHWRGRGGMWKGRAQAPR